MVKKWKKEYPLETELNKLLKEFRVLVRKTGKFYTTIPKNKVERYFWIIDVLATIWLFGRLFGRW